MVERNRKKDSRITMLIMQCHSQVQIFQFFLRS